MKKFYFLTTAICLLFVMGCSDDDENTQFNKSYTGENLTLAYNGYPATGTIQLSSEDLLSGTVTLKSLLPGESENLIPVTITAATASNTYNFTGTTKNDFREIKVEGTAGDKMDIKVTTKDLSKLAGTWMPANPQGNGKTTLELVITPGTKTTIDMNGVLGQSDVALIDEYDSFQNLIQSYSTIIFLTTIDFKLTMNENGFLVANWGPLNESVIPEGSSDNGVVKYNVVDKQVFVSIPIGSLLPQQRADLPSGLDLSIPLGIEIYEAENGTSSITATLNKTLLTTLLTALEPVAKQKFKELNLGEAALEMGITGENLTGFYDELLTTIKDCQEFQIKINMMKKPL